MNELASYTVCSLANINFHNTLHVPDNTVLILHTIHIRTHQEYTYTHTHFNTQSNCTGTLGKLDDRRKIATESKLIVAAPCYDVLELITAYLIKNSRTTSIMINEF